MGEPYTQHSLELFLRTNCGVFGGYNIVSEFDRAVVSDVVDLELSRLERINGVRYNREDIPHDIVDRFAWRSTSADLVAQVMEHVR